MTSPQSFIHVIFPQMFKVIFLAYVTQGIWGMLNTSLGMLVGLQELSGATQYAQSASFTGFDTTHKGNWVGTYGTDGYIIANGADTHPGYATVGFSGTGAQHKAKEHWDQSIREVFLNRG